MEIGKKGVFFTIIALTIVSLIIVSFTGVPRFSSYYHKDFDVLDAEFQILDSYVSEVKTKYAKLILYTQTYHALLSMLDWIETNDSPLVDVQVQYTELLAQGRIFGTVAPLMENMTISNWTDRMNEQAWRLLKIRSDFVMSSPVIYQREPWSIRATANYSLNVTKGNMSYSINDTITVDVPIYGLQDPVYLFYGENNAIEQSSILNWNWSTTLQLIMSQQYRKNRAAPSFMMRLVNDTSNSTCCGIESLIDSRFITNPPNTYRVSYVDYLFWTKDRSCDRGNFSLFEVGQISYGTISPGFKLDQQYMAYYGMDNITSAVLFCTR